MHGEALQVTHRPYLRKVPLLATLRIRQQELEEHMSALEKSDRERAAAIAELQSVVEKVSELQKRDTERAEVVQALEMRLQALEATRGRTLQRGASAMGSVAANRLAGHVNRRASGLSASQVPRL